MKKGIVKAVEQAKKVIEEAELCKAEIAVIRDVER